MSTPDNTSNSQPMCAGAPRNDPQHDYKYVEDEYGWPDGNYKVYECMKCKRKKYVELPD